MIILGGIYWPRCKRRQLGGVERDPNVRSAAWTVEKGDFAQMLLDNFLDDRQAKACPPHPRRHIRLREAIAILGKPDSRIEYVDHEIVVLSMQFHVEAIAGEAMLPTIPPCFNGFNSILDNIGQSLGKLPAVSHHPELALRRLEREGDS